MELNALVAALMSNDNNARKLAEQAYEAAKQQQPHVLVLQLLQLLRTSADPSVRAFAPVLLRRLIESSSGIYAALPQDMRQNRKYFSMY